MQLSATANRQFAVQNVAVTAGQTLSLVVGIEILSGSIASSNICLAFGATSTSRYFVDEAEVPGGVAVPLGKHKLRILISVTASGSLENRLGVGVGGNTTANIIFDSPQLEVGAFPTSYIPTTTTAVTRVADQYTMSGTNFSDWYKAEGGTILVEYLRANPVVSTTWSSAMSFNDGTVSNRIALYADNSLTSDITPALLVTLSGVSQVALNLSPASANISHRLVGAYGTDNYYAAVDGNLPNADTSGTLPQVNRLYVGTDGPANALNGHVRRLAYYPTRLPSAQLQALTAS